MAASLRVEVFTTDLAASRDFWTRVLLFAVRKDDGDYLGLSRGAAHVGVLQQPVEVPAEVRALPSGTEIVLEVDDVVAERDRVVATGWPVPEDLVDRPWGLTDFRLRDPAGYYVRVTSR